MPRPRRDYYAFSLWLSDKETERLQQQAKALGVSFSEAANIAIKAKVAALGSSPKQLTIYANTAPEITGNYHIEKATGDALGRLTKIGFRRQDVGRSAVIEWLAGLL